MFNELEVILGRALQMFEEGVPLLKIRKYLLSNVGSISGQMIHKVADDVGISDEELKFNTGESFGTTRVQRPRNTFKLIVAATIGLLVLFKRDTAKVKKSLRANSTVGGVPLGGKFFKEYSKAKTKKDKDKLLKSKLGDVLNNTFKVKLFRRSGMISTRYLVNEAEHVDNKVKQKIAVVVGKRFMFIPKTAHGHLDECKPYEGRYWAISSGIPLPPYHVNCKHKVRYLKELPENQKESSPIVAAKAFKEATK
jgi:hypothetical protein